MLSRDVAIYPRQHGHRRLGARRAQDADKRKVQAHGTPPATPFVSRECPRGCIGVPMFRPHPVLSFVALACLAMACQPSSPPEPSTEPAPMPSLSVSFDVDSGVAPTMAMSDPSAPLVDDQDASPTQPIDPLPQPLTTTVTVRRGESLAHFARWSGLPVEAIAEASGRSLSSPLDVGETLVIPGDAAIRSSVEQARQRHHQVRAEAYLETRGGTVGTAFHTVRTGETGWHVATRELGLPVWLVEAYNPSTDLDALRPGQQLMYPIVADTVASVDPTTPGSSEAP